MRYRNRITTYRQDCQSCFHTLVDTSLLLPTKVACLCLRNFCTRKLHPIPDAKRLMNEIYALCLVYTLQLVKTEHCSSLKTIAQTYLAGGGTPSVATVTLYYLQQQLFHSYQRLLNQSEVQVFFYTVQIFLLSLYQTQKELTQCCSS